MFVTLVFLTVLVLDQLTKYIVVQNLPLGASWPSRDAFFRITHVANTGSAFGLFGGQNAILTVAALVGIGVLILFYRTHPNPGLLVRTSLSLMLAGALGNLIDRINHGWVTDFIDIGPWYIFNVADAAIVTGVIVLGYSMLFQKQPEQPADRSKGAPEGAEEDDVPPSAATSGRPVDAERTPAPEQGHGDGGR